MTIRFFTIDIIVGLNLLRI